VFVTRVRWILEDLDCLLKAARAVQFFQGGEGAPSNYA